MKRFREREVEEAVDCLLAGGQALHCHRIIADHWKAPGSRRSEASMEDLREQVRRLAAAWRDDARIHRITVDRYGARHSEEWRERMESHARTLEVVAVNLEKALENSG